MWCARAAFVALVALTAASAPTRRANGQELRGVVRDSSSQLPIPGAVVTLQDIAAATLARTITNERGQFRVILLGDSVRRVRVIRLGFRPAVARLPEPVDGVIRVDVVMSSISMALTPVQVKAGPDCPRRGDRERALSVLEQARAGLLATVVARSDKPARMVRLRAIRTMDGFTDRIIHQRVTVDSAEGSIGSFGAARNASDLVRYGFTADSAGLVLYFGPDAEVLLDDRFAAGYCFHSDGGRAKPIESDRARLSTGRSSQWTDRRRRRALDRHRCAGARRHRISLPRHRSACRGVPSWRHDLVSAECLTASS